MNKIKNTLFWDAACVRAIRAFVFSFIGAIIAELLLTNIDFRVVCLASLFAACASILSSLIFGIPEHECEIYDDDEEDEDLADLEAD